MDQIVRSRTQIESSFVDRTNWCVGAGVREPKQWKKSQAEAECHQVVFVSEFHQMMLLTDLVAQGLASSLCELVLPKRNIIAGYIVVLAAGGGVYPSSRSTPLLYCHYI